MSFSDASNGNLFNSNITVPYGSLEVANYSLTLLAIGVLIGALISLLLEMARNGPSGIADAIVRWVYMDVYVYLFVLMCAFISLLIYGFVFNVSIAADMHI